MASEAVVVQNGVVEKPQRIRSQPSLGPKWLNKFFFSDILRKDYESFKVVNYKIEPAIGKGENYVAVMYRVKMAVENNVNGLETRSLIVKVDQEQGPSAELMKEFNVFPKEIEMYNEIIPAFEKMYKAVGEDVQFGPKCFLAGSEPAYLIIMEDLCLKGFNTSDRRLGLNIDHSKLVLEKLAKFHAASAVYRLKNGPFKKHFDYGIFAEHLKPMMKRFYTESVGDYYDILPKWKYGHLIKPLFDNWETALLDKVHNTVKRDEKRFNVLCHGDLWSNNVMFKNDEFGNPISNLLVDFQMCNYNSPALDLVYFIFSSTAKDIRLEKIDFFLQFYHQHLKSNLKKLGYKEKIPTLLDLHKDFLDLGFFGFSLTLNMLAMVLAEPGNDSDMNNLMANDEKAKAFKMRLNTGQRYLEALDQLLPYFHQKGHFDLD